MSEDFIPVIEDDEEDNPIKGIMIALVPSLAIWGIIGFTIWKVVA